MSIRKYIPSELSPIPFKSLPKFKVGQRIYAHHYRKDDRTYMGEIREYLGIDYGLYRGHSYRIFVPCVPCYAPLAIAFGWTISEHYLSDRPSKDFIMSPKEQEYFLGQSEQEPKQIENSQPESMQDILSTNNQLRLEDKL